jgi:alkylhydroperoxidase family enzyme
MIAKWNACAFCVGAHGAVAAKEMQRPAVDEVFSDFRTAPISERLKPALAFLEVMTLRPQGSLGRACKGRAQQRA